MNGKLKIVIGSIIITALIIYSAGVASQLIYALSSWFGSDGGFGQSLSGLVSGMASGNETVPATPLNIGYPQAVLNALINAPYNLYGFIAVALLVGLIIVFLTKNKSQQGVMDNERNLVYSNKGTYGTAGWMNDEELHSELEVTNDLKNVRGTILGKLSSRHDNARRSSSVVGGNINNKADSKISGDSIRRIISSLKSIGTKVVCVPEDTMMNRNVAVYGAAGSMKSRAYVRNKVFQCVRRGESLILTDPKSELFSSMAEYLRDNGYVVKVFNLISPENSDSWNCLREIEGNNQELMAQIFCDVVIRNTLLNGKMDAFWDTGAIALLKALCLYVVQVYPEKDRNIGEVYKLLANVASSSSGSGSGYGGYGGGGSGGNALRAAFDALPFGHSAKVPFEIFQQSSDNVQSGIIIGLANRIQVFQIEALRMITSHSNGIDLTLPGKQKCAYFCITSDQDSTFDFLSSLFLSFLFIKLVRFADSQPNQSLPVPVHLLGDELANIGTIPDLTKKISTIRSRKISMSVIFQNIAQMQNRYPDNAWLEIIGNCDTQLFLGCTDELTAKFISDRTGEVTIGVESMSKELSAARITNYTPSHRETSSIGKRKLLTPDEVLRLPRDDALVILRGQKVLRVKKFDYTKHPEAKKLRNCNAMDYIPNWRAVSDSYIGTEMTGAAERTVVSKGAKGQELSLDKATYDDAAETSTSSSRPVAIASFSSSTLPIVDVSSSSSIKASPSIKTSSIKSTQRLNEVASSEPIQAELALSVKAQQRNPHDDIAIKSYVDTQEDKITSTGMHMQVELPQTEGIQPYGVIDIEDLLSD